jgi:hypothetical protein
MSDTPLVFISWSGERSRRVAQALHEWLPDVIQSLDPWMSGIDIEKGSRWDDEVFAKLNEAAIGIVCLTSQNLDSHWLLFEAGALAKQLTKARVCTYLFDLQYRDVKRPLEMFQHTVAEKDDTRKLIGTINACQPNPLERDRLERTFEAMWPNLDVKLRAIPKLPESEKPNRSTDDMMSEVLERVRRFPDDIKVALSTTAVDRFLEAMLPAIENMRTAGWGGAGTSGRSTSGGWGGAGTSGRSWGGPGPKGPHDIVTEFAATPSNRNAPETSGPSPGARTTLSGSGRSDQSNKAGGASEPEK